MIQIPDAREYKPWRYVSNVVMTIKGWPEVYKARFVPVSARTDADFHIAAHLGVLVLDCANGERRVYGFTDGRINSELRMIVRLSDFHMRDDVVRKWTVCDVWKDGLL